MNCAPNVVGNILKAITFLPRFLSTSKMSAVITLNVRVNGKKTIISFNLRTTTVL